MKNRLLVAALVMLAALAICGCKPRELSREEARELVRDIRHAKAEVSLKGELTTAVRLGDRHVNAQATIRRGDGRLQLEFTAGKTKGVKIIEQGGSVWQIAPDGKAVRRLPRNPLDQMPPLGKKAVVTVAPGGRVVGRPTDNVVIRPHPDSAARLEIWADKETRFPLAADRYNHDGELISSTRYTAVDFSAPAPEQVKLPKAPTGRGRFQQAEKIDKAKAAEVLGQEPLEPKYLPEGFELQGYYAHNRQRGEAVEVRYSDGVRLLNIIEMKLPGREQMRKAWEEKQKQVPGRDEARADQARARQERHEELRERWERALAAAARGSGPADRTRTRPTPGPCRTRPETRRHGTWAAATGRRGAWWAATRPSWRRITPAAAARQAAAGRMGRRDDAQPAARQDYPLPGRQPGHHSGRRGVRRGAA